MRVVRAIALFGVAEIGGVWLIRQGAREHRGVAWIGAGIAALAVYQLRWCRDVVSRRGRAGSVRARPHRGSRTEIE